MRDNHTITRLPVHIVWGTKYRYQVLKGEIQKRNRGLIIQICDAEDVGFCKVQSVERVAEYLEHHRNPSNQDSDNFLLESVGLSVPIQPLV